MNIDAYDLIAIVKDYLRHDVVPVVPPEKRSDLRAAVKLLEEISSELNALYPLLVEECSQISRLCEQAGNLLVTLKEQQTLPSEKLDAVASLVSSCQLTSSSQSLSQLVAEKAKANQVIGSICVAFQDLMYSDESAPGTHESISHWLNTTYESLGEFSARRIEWQSVFPRDQKFSDLCQLHNGV